MTEPTQTNADVSKHGQSDREVSVLREYEPLTELLSQIPHKVQKGIRSQVEILELTCLDANKDFIAVGTNIAIVFLYDRHKHSLQRLRSENTEDSISSVCLHDGLDHLVAIGYQSGTIHVFQLPSMLMGHSKQLERFVVADLHSVPVRCLSWSTNGMKLYSGDTSGCVGCTEVDFYEGQCKSSPVLIECNTEIVQLQQAHRSLLVATRHRCLICRMDDKAAPAQVGSKDRKILGDFGACFIPAMCKPEDAQLYASRPGFRIWKSTVYGTVNNTVMFKDLFSQPHAQIQVSPFDVRIIEKAINQPQFGPLLVFHGTKLVTWNDSCLYVLDPENIEIIGVQKHIGNIRSVAVSEDEIFVLRTNTDRNLIRISTKPMEATTSKILKQLQMEREEKEKEEKENSTKIVEEPGTQKDKSAFKLFQGNLIDRVKKIPNPIHIKDKIQEKLRTKNPENETPQASRYSQEYVFETEVSETVNKRDISPPGELPPVVKLTSPTLKTVLIGVEASITSGDKDSDKLTMKKLSSVEQLAISVLDTNPSDAAAFESSSEVQSTMLQTGSRANYVQQSSHENQSMSEVGQPVRGGSPFPQPEDDGGIVFSQKKTKAKKKKKGVKGNRLKPADRDSDTISINSTTSAGSYTSETVTPTTVSQDDARDTHANDISPPNDNSPSDQLSDISKETLDEHDISDVPGDISNDSVVDQAPMSIKTSDIPSDIVEGTEITEAEKESYSESNTGKLTDSEPSAAKRTEIMVITDMCANTQEVTKSDTKAVPGSNNQTPVSKSGTKTVPVSDIQKPVNINEYQSLSANNSSYRSNLDKEMARLNSYLSETSEGTDNTLNELVESTSSTASQSSASQRREEVERILLKDTMESYNQLEQEIISQVNLETKETYKESSLDRQLKELENESMGLSNMNEPNISVSQTPITGSQKPPTSSHSKENSPMSPTDDFYSQFIPKSSSILSSASSDPLTGTALIQKDGDSDLESEDTEEDTIQIVDTPQTIFVGKSVNTWMEISAAGNIYSLSVSNSHVWYTDKSYNIYYSSLHGPGLSWRKATGYASQIAVSPLGNIVWCLYRNTVLAGTKITAKHPEGMKWVEAVRDVAYISVDETCAWYIKTTHEVMMQKGLSRERPCYTAKVIDCPFKLRQIVCRAGVVWALTDSCQWIYRHGIKLGCPEGTQWNRGDSGSENHLFSCIALGDGNTGWAMDVIGHLWFCCGVTMDTPRGDSIWWQVPFSGEYLMKDLSTMDMLKSLTRKLDPQKLAYLLSNQRGGLLSATGGVWVCPDYKHVIHVCRGSLEGHHWTEAHPEGLASTSAWKTVVATNAANPNGLIWAQQPNGDVLTFTTDRRTCSSVPSPKAGTMFVCMSACTDALWALTDGGDVYIRTEMGERHPQGGGWCKLDLAQLDESHVVHVSCSKTNIWAVDSDGAIFHRIGVRAPTDHCLNAAWLPVDNGGTVFTQIVTGSQDWMVWAVDNRRQVYVRSGITVEMPIGRKWVHVPGTPAMRLSLSDHHVWAVNLAGELLCRYGVSDTNVAGDYWKKSPGILACVSATPTDILWGINREGQLVRRRTKYIIKKSQMEEETAADTGDRHISVCSDDADWEFV